MVHLGAMKRLQVQRTVLDCEQQEQEHSEPWQQLAQVAVGIHEAKTVSIANGNSATHGPCKWHSRGVACCVLGAAAAQRATAAAAAAQQQCEHPSLSTMSTTNGETGLRRAQIRGTVGTEALHGTQHGSYMHSACCGVDATKRR